MKTPAPAAPVVPSAPTAGVQRANLYSRLATRILVQVAHAEISHEDDILDLARATPWERWFGAEQTLRVDTSAIKSPVQSLQYCNLRAKDGICDRLREREGERPDIDTVRPDARVHLFLTGHTATLYLDTSGNRCSSAAGAWTRARPAAREPGGRHAGPGRLGSGGSAAGSVLRLGHHPDRSRLDRAGRASRHLPSLRLRAAARHDPRAGATSRKTPAPASCPSWTRRWSAMTWIRRQSSSPATTPSAPG